MRCPNCDGSEFDVRREDHVYEEAGLENVVLVGLEISYCKACNEKLIHFPRLAQLNRLIAFDLAGRPEKLAPAEIRFLRKYLGYSQTDFGAIIDADVSTVSRWENGKQEMGSTSERLLRLMVQRQRPIEEYPTAMLAKAATTPVRRERICFERGASGWHESDRC
jgi:putative zinc finger/helix-turn-helix YgiT family protein